MTSTDVVVGGRAIWSSAAYYLSTENMKVALLERRELASEAFGANIGGFCIQLETGTVMNLGLGFEEQIFGCFWPRERNRLVSSRHLGCPLTVSLL